MNDSSDKKSVEVLMILRDKDIFPSAQDTLDVIWWDRPTGKVVLFNEANNIALIGNKVHNSYLLPGGGIEENESVEDGVKRECREETGCEIEILDALGITEDFRSRDSRHCITFGYSAKVISYGTQSPTTDEAEAGVYVKWVPLSEAIEILERQEEKVRAGEVKFYNTCFNTLRDSLFVRRARDLVRMRSSG